MKVKENKGITLIVLIITIIIMLILVGVAINLTIDSNLFDNAKKAVGDTNEKVGQTQARVDELMGNVDDAKKFAENQSAAKTVYAKLYTDGTLILSSTNYTDSSRTVDEDYGDISKKVYHMDYDMWEISGEYPGWIEVRDDGNAIVSKATNVIIHDKIYPTNTSCWFIEMDEMTEIEGLDNLNTSKVTEMTCMFYDCYALEKINLKNFNTSKVTDMAGMFEDCNAIEELDVTSFDTSNVTNMYSMFYDCYSLKELDLTNFNTSNVTDMGWMFGDCHAIEELDLTSFDTSKIDNMQGMFGYCENLSSILVGAKWVTDSSEFEMFEGCLTNEFTHVD